MNHPLTSSEMGAWNTCKRGWWISYYRELRRAHDLPSLPTVGNFVHGGLESYYKGELKDPSEKVKDQADALAAYNPEFADQIAKDAELSTIMLDGYLEWLEETGADDGLEPVGAEEMVEAPVGPYLLRGKIDARLRRESDGALLQLEHKTVGNLADIPKTAQSNPQFLTYDLLAFLTKPDGTHTDGLIINMLRRVKRTARAHPPFYGRHEVRHNTEEMRSHYKHVLSIGHEITDARRKLDDGADHHLVVPPNVNRNHTWLCACREVTTMFDDGSDVEGFLEEFYVKSDPLGRYNEPKEE